MMEESRTTNPDVESAVNQSSMNPEEKRQKTICGVDLDKSGTLLTAVVLVVVLVMGLALGLALGLHDCDDERTDERFQVTLTINTNGPVIETSNTSSVSFNGASSTTWYFPYYLDDNNLEPLFTTFGEDGWFDQAVRVRRVDDRHSSMRLKVYFHNFRKMEQLMRSIFPSGAVTEPECTTAIKTMDLHSVPMGGTSKEFALGDCSVTRLDSLDLEPQKIDMVFTGIVSVDRGWQGSPRYSN